MITLNDCIFLKDKIKDLEDNIQKEDCIIKQYSLNEYISCVFYKVYFEEISKYFKKEGLDKWSEIDDFLEFGNPKISNSNNPDDVKKSLRDYADRIKKKITQKYSSIKF